MRSQGNHLRHLIITIIYSIQTRKKNFEIELSEYQEQ